MDVRRGKNLIWPADFFEWLEESLDATLCFERAGLPTVLLNAEAQRSAYLRAIAVDKRLAGERVDFSREWILAGAE